MADKTVYCCPGWKVNGKPVHEVTRYKIGDNGTWVTMGQVEDAEFATIVNARRNEKLSHGMCTICEVVYGGQKP